MLDAVRMIHDLLGKLDANLRQVVKALRGVEVVADNEKVFVSTFELRNRLRLEVTDCGNSGHLFWFIKNCQDFCEYKNDNTSFFPFSPSRHFRCH